VLFLFCFETVSTRRM